MNTRLTAGRYVGQAVKRIEDPRLLAGRGRYVDDVQLPNMLHVAFVRSNVARGNIVSIDTSEAKALPGVHAVYTGDDLNPRVQQFWHTMIGPPIEMGGQTHYAPLKPLAQGDVRFVGDPIAIIIADNRYIAEDAADLVQVEIDPLPAVVGILNGARDDALVHKEKPSNISDTMPIPEVPEVEALFATAPHVFTRRFHQARATNVPMEPRGIVVHYDRYAGDMQIWAATQSVSEWRSSAARLTGLGENRVRVIANDVGGGFGQKMMVTRDEAAVIMAGHLFGEAPIKWTEDRRENLMTANQAREEIFDVTMAVTDDGTLMGAKVFFWEDIGSYPAGAGAGAGLAGGVFPGPYKFPVVLPGGSAVFTNTVGKAAYRGPWMGETVAREQMMDHVAYELGIDPIEIRRKNVIKAEDLPYTTCTTMVYESVTPSETMEQALEMLDVDAFRAMQAEARKEGRLLGMGLAVYIEPSAIAFGILSSDQAIMRMDNTGKVIVAMSTGNHGHSLETTIPQVVAEHLGCDINDVVLVQGDTDSSPMGPGTGGSRSAVIAGGAAQTASLRLKDKILQIAAHMLEASPEDLEVNNSVVSVKGTPAKALPFAMIAPIAYQMPEMLPPGMEMGLEVTARYQPPGPFTWSNAAHVCTVEIDAETGHTKILRYIVSEDCGRMINPMVVEGQIAGGVVQGIGGVLFEHLVYDDEGNPLTTTFLDYLLPTAPEVPDIEIGHIETLSPTLGGYKGMGEGGAIVAPPAVANAIHDALRHLGVHPTDFPLGPSQVLALMNEAAQA
ncbi:MAG: xanthine dehydrogenase family protein molybdopterin-binding subunit [Actinomycetota bacterium]|nr:xanthine dehydrogenase family protein molybdopterin-binding subunit [Actinomycetota bacterium]